jgi:hypothetical protein
MFTYALLRLDSTPGAVHPFPGFVTTSLASHPSGEPGPANRSSYPWSQKFFWRITIRVTHVLGWLHRFDSHVRLDLGAHIPFYVTLPPYRLCRPNALLVSEAFGLFLTKSRSPWGRSQYNTPSIAPRFQVMPVLVNIRVPSQ